MISPGCAPVHEVRNLFVIDDDAVVSRAVTPQGAEGANRCRPSIGPDGPSWNPRNPRGDSHVPKPILLSRPRAPRSRTSRRRRGLGLLVLVAIGVVTLSGCLPGIPLSQWVPDANGDGQIDATEVASAQQAIADQWARSMEQQRRQTQMHPFLVCVRHFESDRGAFPFDRGYAAQNPTSTASGAYQFLDSTWRGASATRRLRRVRTGQVRALVRPGRRRVARLQHGRKVGLAARPLLISAGRSARAHSSRIPGRSRPGILRVRRLWTVANG